MKINPNTLDAYHLLHDGTLAFADAEQAGFRVDMEYVERKKKFLTKKILHLEEKFKDSKLYQHWEHSAKGKVNIHSHEQLSHFLYNVKKIKIEKQTDTGKGSTDNDALSQMNIPELNILLQAQKLKKVRDTYLDAFAKEQVDGILHPFFNLHLPRTYRSSSDSPNFQNIPNRDEESMKLCRQALYPRIGHQFLELDYSGLEVRVAACYHKDPTMLKYLHDGHDFHADITKQIFMIKNFNKSIPEYKVLRDATKNGFVFPEFYGDYYKNCAIGLACDWGKLSQERWKEGEGIPMPEGTLSDHLINNGLTSLKKFEKHLQELEKIFWRDRFPHYAKWKERWWNLYKKKGYVDLYTGFRCSGVMNKKEVINYPIQGAAFHCLLWSFIQLNKIFIKGGWKSRIIGQVHDSILIDLHPSELNRAIKLIKRVTCTDLREAWKWINVPLDVDIELCPIDGSWADKAKFN